MTHLYELTGQYQALVNTLEASEDLKPEDFDVALSQLKDSIEDKAINVGKAVLSYEAEAVMVKAEAQRLLSRAQQAERVADRLREYLKREMELANILKIKRPEFTISIVQNPPRGNILDEQAIPAAFWRIIPETRQVDKRLILEKAKLGESVDGVVVETTTRLSIK